MRIEMSKRKPGIYAYWFEIIGISQGKICRFSIKYDEAKNYCQAVRFFNKTWGKKNKALLLRNAEPFSNTFAMAC